MVLIHFNTTCSYIFKQTPNRGVHPVMGVAPNHPVVIRSWLRIKTSQMVPVSIQNRGFHPAPWDFRWAVHEGDSWHRPIPRPVTYGIPWVSCPMRGAAVFFPPAKGVQIHPSVSIHRVWWVGWIPGCHPSHLAIKFVWCREPWQAWKCSNSWKFLGKSLNKMMDVPALPDYWRVSAVTVGSVGKFHDHQSLLIFSKFRSWLLCAAPNRNLALKHIKTRSGDSYGRQFEMAIAWRLADPWKSQPRHVGKLYMGSQ